MDICVLPRVGDFRLGKLVSILSYKINGCVPSHTRSLAEYFDVTGNALDTHVTIGSYFVHIVAQYLLPNHVNTIFFI